MTSRGNKPPSQRQLRVGEEMRHILADALSRGDLRDPELQDRVITVTEVRISPDLRNATVYVIPLGGTVAPEILPALRRAAPYLRGVVGRAMDLRHVPQLFFEADNSFEHAARIDALMHSEAVRRDLASKPEAEAASKGSADPE